MTLLDLMLFWFGGALAMWLLVRITARIHARQAVQEANILARRRGHIPPKLLPRPRDAEPLKAEAGDA